MVWTINKNEMRKKVAVCFFCGVCVCVCVSSSNVTHPNHSQHGDRNPSTKNLSFNNEERMLSRAFHFFSRLRRASRHQMLLPVGGAQRGE